MSWFDNIKTPKIKEKPSEKVVKVPEGFWVKCTSCGEILQSKTLKDNLQVCTECDYHFRVGAWERIAQLTEDHFHQELDGNLSSKDPLEFSDTKPYRKRLDAAAEKTRQLDSIITGKGEIGGIPVMIGSFEFRFMGGSMGVVAGEKITRLFEAALQEKLPVVLVSSSGGARMQEGILSLMQMAKTSALVQEMKKHRLPYISVLTDPTTGGVAASFAMLGDLILAEPGALIGFAGPRVVEQTMRQALPQGFQRSEFLLKHGFVDMIVQRKDLPQTLAKILRMLKQGTWENSGSKETSGVATRGGQPRKKARPKSPRTARR